MCELKWMRPSTRMSDTILIIQCYRRQNISLDGGIHSEITQKRNVEFHSAVIVRYTRYVVCSIWYGFINGQDIQKSYDKEITHVFWVLFLSFHSMVQRASNAIVEGNAFEWISLFRFIYHFKIWNKWLINLYSEHVLIQILVGFWVSERMNFCFPPLCIQLKIIQPIKGTDIRISCPYHDWTYFALCANFIFYI